MKVLFFDKNNDGHHWFYNTELMINFKKNGKFSSIIYLTKNISKEQIQFLHSKGIEVLLMNENVNCIKGIRLLNQLENIYEMKQLKRISLKKKVDCIINLYFDKYIFPYVFSKKVIKTINVLHWYPNNKFKQLMLSLIRYKIDKFIVHTEDVKNKFFQKNKKILIELINYPVKRTSAEEVNKEDYLKSLRLPQGLNDQVILLYFGGTRHDKGLDILLNACSLIKTDLTLLIAGKESTFDRVFIEEKLIKSKIKYHLELDYIEEENVLKYFSIAHAIVLPYRKYFNGESGVLTDAIQMGKPIVVPNIIHFPSVINEYHNGVIFKAEDSVNLANSIDSLFENYSMFYNSAQVAKDDIQDKRSIDNFISDFLRVIKDLKE